ncbi:hypothetical protein HG530_014001 [Fusarium avenaceum]|nr:hypothetical protein HG530_014001 [Fusarium avenaceum]
MDRTALLHGRHVTLLRVVEHGLLRRLGLWHRTSCLLNSGILWLTIEPWVDHSRWWHRRSYRKAHIKVLTGQVGLGSLKLGLDGFALVLLLLGYRFRSILELFNSVPDHILGHVMVGVDDLLILPIMPYITGPATAGGIGKLL